MTKLKNKLKISDETRQGRCADETEISSGGSSAWRSGGRHFVRTQCKGLSRLEPLPESLLLLALYLDVDEYVKGQTYLGALRRHLAGQKEHPLLVKSFKVCRKAARFPQSTILRWQLLEG